MALGARVRGETQVTPTWSEWFRCRIDPKQGTQQRQAGEGRTTMEVGHEFICLLKDVSGADVEISEEDELQIEKGPSPFNPYGTFQVKSSVRRPRDLREDILIHIPRIQRLEED